MTAIVPPEKSSATSAPNWAAEMRYVARQPILNQQGRVHGYELLFRNGPEAVSSRDVDMATRTMLDNAVIFGLERFTNGLPAFVTCTVESLTENLVNVLAPDMTVLAIPSSLELTPSLVDSCRELKEQGFRLALDDFTADENLQPLVELVSYIRVDFSRLPQAERQNLRPAHAGLVAMIAKNLETQGEYQQACAEGFTLFQGDYFCHPVLLQKTKIPANRLFHFEIVRQLLHDPIDLQQVSKLVMRDAALTYRLLRLVNSPIYAIHKEVRSVQAAILIVGENTLRRVVPLAILSEVNADQPPVILNMALVRARFCELAAAHCDLDPAEQYLMGMLSLLPAMLRLPMEELIPSLPVRDQICEALQGTMNPERRLLTWLEFHEHGDWEACDSIVQAIDPSQAHLHNQPLNRQPLDQDQLIRCYADAVVWAEAALRSAI